VVSRGSAVRSALAIARMKTFDARTLAGVTGALKVLYWPPVLLVVLALAALTQGWLYAVHGLGASLHDAFYTPGFMLLMLVSVVVAAGFHELGHAAALRYGGGTPRSFGLGMYLMYPVFFTDVSDNYRLRRWARVRTDLGGFYFNLIFALVVFGAYVLTRQEALLVVIVVMNFEIIRQLMPFVRLDGYWTLADLTGMPDFLSKMGAFVRSTLPWSPPQAKRKMPALKPWARVVFAIYVLATIPALIVLLVLTVRSVPRVLATAWDALGQQAQTIVQAWSAGNVLGAVGATLQGALILLPVAGLLYSLFKLGRAGIRWAWQWSEGSRRRRSLVAAGGVAAIALVYAMWAPQLPWPGSGRLSSPLYAPGTYQPVGEDERLSMGDALTGTIAARPASAELPTWLPHLPGATAAASAQRSSGGSDSTGAPPPPPPDAQQRQVQVPAPADAAPPQAPPPTGLAQPQAPQVPDVSQPQAPAVSGVAQPVATAVPAVGQPAATAVSGAVPPVATAVPALAQPVATTVPAEVPPVATSVAPVTGGAPPPVDAAPTAVATVVHSAPTAVATVVESAPTAVATLVSSAPTKVATVVDSAPTAVATVVNEAPTAIATLVAPLAEATPAIPPATPPAIAVEATPQASPAVPVSLP
jgi:hypothetical protein